MFTGKETIRYGYISVSTNMHKSMLVVLPTSHKALQEVNEKTSFCDVVKAHARTAQFKLLMSVNIIFLLK